MVILLLGNWNKTNHFHYITHNRLSLPPNPDQNNDQTAIKKRKETRRWHDNVDLLDKVTSLLEPGDLGPWWVPTLGLGEQSDHEIWITCVTVENYMELYWLGVASLNTSVGTICRCVRSLSGNVAMYVLPIKVITKKQSDVTQHSQYYHLLTAPDHPKTSESLLLAVPVPALCLPNKGNHRDTRLVHKGELHYKHTICQGT